MPLSDILKGLRAIWGAWTWFWFRPISAKGTGIMRITLGMMLVMTSIDVFPDLEILIGPNGVYAEGAAKRGMRLARWTYFDRIGTLEGMQIAHGLGLLCNILFMVGYKSRTTGILSLLANVALYQRNTWFMNGGDRLVREMTFYLCFVPCGATFSVDAWLKDRKLFRTGQRIERNPKIPILAMRLIQIQIAVVYFLSGLEKWDSGSWHRGSALYYSLSTNNYARSDWLVAPLLDGRLGYDITQVGTAITLYWEVGFWLFVLWRPTRWAALVVGVLMHAGTHIFLMVAYFSSISVWAYMAYLPHDWVERLTRWWTIRKLRASAR